VTWGSISRALAVKKRGQALPSGPAPCPRGDEASFTVTSSTALSSRKEHLAGPVQNSRGKTGREERVVSHRRPQGSIAQSRKHADRVAPQIGDRVDDEILAIDEYRVKATAWESRKKRYRPGDQVAFLITRGDRLMTIAVTFGERPANRWQLQIDPDATDEQKAHLEAWLASVSGAS